MEKAKKPFLSAVSMLFVFSLTLCGVLGTAQNAYAASYTNQEIGITSNIEDQTPTLSQTEMIINAGASKKLKLLVNGEPVTATWKTSDKSVASVSCGMVYAKKAGTATITATHKKKQYTCEVTVKKISFSKVSSLSESTYDDVIADIDEYLSSDGRKIDQVFFAKDITVSGSGLRNVLIKGVNAEENAILFHIKDGNVEEVEYTLEDNELGFGSSTFSPFVLASVTDEEPAAYTGDDIKALHVSLDEGRSNQVYTHDTLFTDWHGEFGEAAGFVAKLELSDGSFVKLNDPYAVEITPFTAPAEEGEFDATFSYTAEDGAVFTDTITMNAVYAEPVMDSYQASNAAGLRGSVNGKSLRHIIFTDTVEPSDEETATKAYIGSIQAHAVVAYRLIGQEDTLYITSGRPGVKVIHSGESGTINTGFIYDIDCRMLDTSRCKTINLFWANGGAFQFGVKSINYSGCDFSNITSLSSAFNTYQSLQYLDLSNCDFSNVEDMSYMCFVTPNLVKVDMSGTVFTPGKVKNMKYAFGKSGLQEIDLGGLETSGATNAEGMFVEDKNLKELDMSGCDLSNVENAAYMFQENEALETLILNEKGMPSLKDSMRQMFDNCKNLKNVDLSGLNFSNVTDVFRVLYNCQKLQTTLNIDATNLSNADGYTFADMAIDDDADVVVNCTQASKDKLINKKMIWATSAQYNQHVRYNVTDSASAEELSVEETE